MPKMPKIKRMFVQQYNDIPMSARRHPLSNQRRLFAKQQVR